MKEKSEYSIQTVRNALRLLEAFFDDEELGVSELSRRLELHKNNVFRLLATLEQAGYVDQCIDSDRYRLGARCVELGRAFGRGQVLIQRARPFLEDLASDVGETAHLAILRDYSVVHLDGFQPDRQILSSLRIGHRLPAHCAALGKVLLGCAAPAVRESFDRDVVRDVGLEAHSDHTIVDPHKLLEALHAVAGQGYALDFGECQEDLRCAAAPVYDDSGQVVAALSISGPAYRLDDEVLHREVIPVVVEASASLSHQLGAV